MTTKRNKRYFLYFILINTIFLLKGQSVAPLKVQIPTSPQAEAFQKFGDIAINYSTGTPNITIPLFEINHRGYKLPLSLRYNPQPLKPGYNYDVYGQGWGLSINSCISRSIEYAPDEEKGFKIETDKLNLIYCPYCEFMNVSEEANSSRLNISGYNFAHDKFNVVLPNGSSFNFIMEMDNSNNMTYKVSDGRSVKINCTWSIGNILKFEVVDEDGVRYTFEQGDIAHPLSGSSNSTFFVSWQLTRIDLPYSSESITINYNNSVTSPIVACPEPGLTMTGDRHPFNESGTPLLVRDYNFTIPSISTPYGYRMKLASSISYGDMNISFQYGTTTREGESHRFVKELTIKKGGALVRDIKLVMSQKSLSAGGCAGPFDLVKLDAVCIWGSNTNDKPQVYKCDYLSSGFSFYGTDYWGYLNSPAGNCIANFNVYTEIEDDRFNDLMNIHQNLLTPIARSIPKSLFPYNEFKLSRGNRFPGYPHEHGILSKITYPTGGYTVFEFENNRILTSTDANGEYILNAQNRVSAIAGGFRIKNVTNYNANNTIATTLNYRYGPFTPGVSDVNQISSHTGSGEPVCDPNILTFMTHSARSATGSMRQDIGRYMVLGINERGERSGINNPFNDYLGETSVWECNFSALNFRRILNGRQPVIYPEVTVYYGDPESQSGCTGKTVYKYDIYGDVGSIKELLSNKNSEGLFLSTPNYYGNTIDYEQKSYEYNKQTEKTDYKYENNLFSPVVSEKTKWNKQSEMYLDYVHTNPYPYSTTIRHDQIGNYLSYKMNFIGDSKPSSKETLIYTSDGIIRKIDSIFYNDRRQPYLKIELDSRGSVVKNTFTYPYYVYNGITPTVISKMLEKNIISPVIESKTEVKNDNVTNTTEGEKLEYSEYNNGSILAPGARYQTNIKPSGNEYVLQSQVNFYTQNGNPVELLTKDGMFTTYIWSFQDRYIIAEVKNATLEAVKAALGYTDAQMNSLFASISPDIAIVNTLRTNLPMAHITSYTYNNQGLLSSSTNPLNVTTYYEYDSFNRLSLVRNTDNKIIENNNYNYQDKTFSLSASITPGANTYIIGSTGNATITNVTGGLGSYTYNWSLKNSNGVTLASVLNSSSPSFSIDCTQTGVMTIQCVITDNVTGKSLTTSTNITINPPPLIYGNFTLESGYINFYNSLSNNGTIVSFYLAFGVSGSAMYPGNSYLVAGLPTGFRPSASRTVTLSSGGRTWDIIFNPNGTVYCRIVSGSTLPVGGGIGFNGSFNL